MRDSSRRNDGLQDAFDAAMLVARTGLSQAAQGGATAQERSTILRPFDRVYHVSPHFSASLARGLPRLPGSGTGGHRLIRSSSPEETTERQRLRRVSVDRPRSG
jgi:hypothetical protein